MELMSESFTERAERYHADLPGVVRAALRDQGLTDLLIDERMIGWNGDHIVVPVFTPDGRLCLFERWEDPLEHEGRLGIAASCPRVELFAAETLRGTDQPVFLCEGVLETLIALSHGLTAVGATGTGLFFKQREWRPLLTDAPKVIVAYKKCHSGDFSPNAHRRLHLQTKVRRSLRQSVALQWPADLPGGGFHEFLVTQKRSVEELQTLPNSLLH